MDAVVHRVLDRIGDDRQRILNMGLEEARRRLSSGTPGDMLSVEGSFALTVRCRDEVRMARSLDRPLRYFLAKEGTGPMLVVAERIDEIASVLADHGYSSQFHPTYTRMVPAHHVTTLRLVGCPDPSPRQDRFFTPPRATAGEDLDVLGRSYVGALHEAVRAWLDAQDDREPIGVLFSGGIDSGVVLLSVYHALLESGRSPARLKAFTLSVNGGGRDLRQARSFLSRMDLEMLHEVVEVGDGDLDPFEAVEVIEDYKPLDVECATVALALLRGIRRRYPDWRLIVDGDGGDENLKDYPLEEGGELTIRSVVSNSMLYQEGWGVDAIKHSLTYSGGYSRACVRTYAPANLLGFDGFSPYTRPRVVEAAEAVPFDALTRGSDERLYELKGEIARRGVHWILGRELPVFEKRRFQEGALEEGDFAGRFSVPPEAYRAHYLGLERPAAAL